MRTEDGHIIHKCLNGDTAAFGLLVDKYKASVYALAYSKLHNFHDAEDITQETFLKAYQKLRTLRWWDNFLAPGGSFAASIASVRGGKSLLYINILKLLRIEISHLPASTPQACAASLHSGNS